VAKAVIDRSDEQSPTGAAHNTRATSESGRFGRLDRPSPLATDVTSL